MNLQMLKKAMLAYVSAVKFVWSGIAYPLSIVGRKFMNLRGYRIYGKSVQDGTPTPETPIEIESVGDLSTKNLLDISDFISFYTPYWAFPTEYGYHDEVGEECLKVYGSINADGRALYYMENRFKENTSYTFSLDCYDVFSPTNNISGISFICRYTDETSEAMLPYEVRKNKIWKKHSFTSDPNKTVKAITVSYGTGSAYSYLKNIQLEEGTTATDYEPYHKYKIPVVARGKNMFNKDEYSYTVGCYNDSGEFNQSLNGKTAYFNNYVSVKPNTQYHISSLGGYNGLTVAVYFYDKDKQWLNRKTFTCSVSSLKTGYTFNTPSECYYVRGQIHIGATAAGTFDFNPDTFQFEEGSTATAFEPYIAPVTTNIFLDEPLRKVGDYADYLDFERQKVVRKIKKRDFDGSEDWQVNTIKEITNVYSLLYGAKDAVSKVCISNRFIDSAKGDVEKIVILIDVKRPIYIAINKTTAADLTTFKTWLANNPTYITYALATPTEETVKLPALPQFKGTTIYEVGTNIEPSGIEVKYC